MTIITIKDVCEKLGITRPTLLKLRRSGEFVPEIRVGPRIVVFLERDFNAYLIAHRINTSGQALEGQDSFCPSS